MGDSFDELSEITGYGNFSFVNMGDYDMFIDYVVYYRIRSDVDMNALSRLNYSIGFMPLKTPNIGECTNIDQWMIHNNDTMFYESGHWNHYISSDKYHDQTRDSFETMAHVVNEYWKDLMKDTGDITQDRIDNIKSCLYEVSKDDFTNIMNKFTLKSDIMMDNDNIFPFFYIDNNITTKNIINNYGKNVHISSFFNKHGIVASTDRTKGLTSIPIRGDSAHINSGNDIIFIINNLIKPTNITKEQVHLPVPREGLRIYYSYLLNNPCMIPSQSFDENIKLINNHVLWALSNPTLFEQFIYCPTINYGFTSNSNITNPIIKKPSSINTPVKLYLLTNTVYANGNIDGIKTIEKSE